MAYDRISPIRVAGEDRSDIRIAPTIMIGLGGTGQQVLLKIRRLFAEKYGSLESIPIVRYLYIDTDESNASQEDLTRDNDPLIETLDFAPAERIKISVSVPEYIRNINNYPYVKRWLKCTGKIAELGELDEGAGQIRSASRLAFFEHFNAIRDKINHLDQLVNNIENREYMSRHNIAVNYDSLNIYVVLSLAGGTGSGIFLDMGFLLKEMIRREGVSTIAYAILPGVYSNHGSRTLANGYASLKEVDHYNFGNMFKPQWSSHFADKEYSPPPYSYFYLVDSQCEGGAQITSTNRTKLYDMIAENIFQDFGNSLFADYKRATKVNLKQYLNDLYAYKHLDETGAEVLQEVFSCRYSSFGLYTIRFPAVRVKNACAFKLAADIIHQWGVEWKQNKYGEIDKEILTQIFPRLNILEGSRPSPTGGREQVSQLISRIDKDESGRLSFGVKIEREVEQLRQSLLLEESGWREYFLKDKARIEHNLRGEDSSSQEDWGDWLNVLKRNSDKVLEEVITELEKLMATYSSNPKFGVGFILTLATRIKKYLSGEGMEGVPEANRYIPFFQQEMANIDEMVKNQEEELNDLVEELRDIEQKGGLFRIGHFRPALRRQVDMVAEAFVMLLKLRVEKLLRVNAVEICKGLIEKIGKRMGEGESEEFTGLLRRYQVLFDSISSMHAYCVRMYEYFKRKVDTPMVKNIYEPEELDKTYYPKYMGKGPDFKANLAKHTGELLKELHIEKLDELVSIINREGVTEVGQRIIGYTMSVFDNIEKDNNVLRMLKEKHNFNQDLIAQAISNGKPWIRPSNNTGNYRLDSQQKRYYVGLPEIQGSPLPDEFLRVVQNIDPSPIRKDLGEQSEIIFYSEVAGFPAFYIDKIDSLKEAYTQNMAEEDDLHITKEQYKFKDLMFFSEDERRRWLLCHKAFILGSILNVVVGEHDAREGDIGYKYTYDKGLGIPKEYNLGTEARSIIYMFESKVAPPIYQSVLDEVMAKKVNLDSSEKLACYLAVLKHYQGSIYPVEQRDVGGGATVSMVSLQHSVIEDEVRDISENIKDLNIDMLELRDRSNKILEQMREGQLPPLVRVIENSERLRLSV
jgi:hypothetical protein